MRVIGTNKNGDEIAEVSATELDTMFKEIRAKAIDGFASTLIPRLTDAIYPQDVASMTNLIKEIAEQMKAGGKNEIDRCRCFD